MLITGLNADNVHTFVVVFRQNQDINIYLISATKITFYVYFGEYVQ